MVAPQQRLQAVQQQMRAHEREQVMHPREQDGINIILSPTSSTAFLTAGASPLDIDYLAEYPETEAPSPTSDRKEILPDVDRERKHIGYRLDGSALSRRRRSLESPRRQSVHSGLAQDEESDPLPKPSIFQSA